MKYFLVFSFMYISCNGAVKQQESLIDSSIVNTRKSVDSLTISVQQAQNRLFFILAIRQKRDSFLFKKYENEVLYYQTENDKYRVKANKMIDSVNKYVTIMDSIAKTIK